ncbi:MAG: serine/threonine-protein kinase [Planctomycetota bacterium]
MTKPYLCECGSLVNVAEIAHGALFSCPFCGSESRLVPSDPALLAHFTDSDGVYPMLLERKISEEPAMGEAVPVAPHPDGEKRSKDQTATRTVKTRTPSVPSRAVPRGITLQSGETLGPFRIDGLLGQGGMATVYRAFDTSLQRTVALKVLADVNIQGEEIVHRFRREARAAGALTHPNITHIYSIGEDRGYHYFAMELVMGSTLSSILDEAVSISEEDAIDYLVQVARGLRAAQKKKKIIHRDIKPSNLILSEDGLLKITDFGLAKVITSPVEITATGVIVGTPLYISPEQGKGEPLDHRSDIYSLGCTFYHLLAGSPPFSGDSAMNIIVYHITEEPEPIRNRCPEISSRMAAVIHKMMMKAPMDRFQDYDELIEAISSVSSSAKSSSTRLRRSHGRIVLISEKSEERIPADSMSLKQLSVADVNLELGRHEKALSLYEKVLVDNPQLEIDLSFRMLKIYQQRHDLAQVRRLYRRLLELTEDPKERFFCRWKLLQEQFTKSHEAIADSTQLLEEILSHELPSGVPERRLRQRLEELAQMEKELSSPSGGDIILIRKTGDLQIELD